MISDFYFDPEQGVGETRKFRHENCSENKSKALAVTRFKTGWKFICHRCGVKGKKNIKGLSPEKTIKFCKSLFSTYVVDLQAVKLPDDYSTALPLEALAWLYKYITQEEIEVNRVVYSTSYNRVIFPLYEGNTLTYWTGRYMSTPYKYHQKWFTVASKGRKHFYFRFEKGGDTVVLVEDVLSAICVSRVENCYSLNGSYIPDDLLIDLKKKYKNVIIWLDYDKIGEALKYHRRFEMIGMKCCTVYTKKDPKCYSTDIINRRIYEGSRKRVLDRQNKQDDPV